MEILAYHCYEVEKLIEVAHATSCRRESVSRFYSSKVKVKPFSNTPFFYNCTPQDRYWSIQEAVNQLSLAIAHGKEHKNKPLWLSLLGYTKYLYGNWDDAVTYGVLAMKALDDKEIIPAIDQSLPLMH